MHPVVINGNAIVANSLLNSIDRLSKNEFRQQLIEHELLTKPAIKRFGDRLVKVIAEVLQRHFPDGWDDAMLELSNEIGVCFYELRNDTKDLEGVPLPR